jgi:RHS repeat-associated protein
VSPRWANICFKTKSLARIAPPVASLLTGTGYDELYARIKSPTTTPVTNSLLLDHLGTIIAESDAAGTVFTSYTYEPYGKTTQTGTASDNSQRYTGREQDFGDFYYYRARYYSTNESRFTAEDPIGIRGGVNTYLYVEANPVSVIDPTGLMGFGGGGSATTGGSRSRNAPTCGWSPECWASCQLQTAIVCALPGAAGGAMVGGMAAAGIAFCGAVPPIGILMFLGATAVRTACQELFLEQCFKKECPPCTGNSK